MAAMAIFGVTYVSLPIEDVLVTEAARIATSLQMTRSGADDISPDFQRTFWVIYSLESEFCFNTGRASFVEDMAISQASGTQAGEDLNGVDPRTSHNEDIDLGVLDELLGYQGLPFSIHNYFALEETDFSLACSDISPFPQAESGFVFADFMAESFPETEQGNNGR
ncbi:hypothetical protein BFJ69_g17558 [Fusarium oxysporum]|uniref:Transcription factor domain-containing protein n=1 Tax=Fusarium oxysporum TaxID=5507 RepID=A0A420M7Z9_FUSOX|nr:hypothetical protein BFJ69_g17558 [Fusarium oxysporum]